MAAMKIRRSAIGAPSSSSVRYPGTVIRRLSANVFHLPAPGCWMAITLHLDLDQLLEVADSILK